MDQAIQQRYHTVILAHQHVAKLVCQTHRTAGADCIGKQRMRPVERWNIPFPVFNLRPTRCLNRTRCLQRHLVKVHLPRIGLQYSFSHQPAQISVRGHIVEAVIMHPGVRHVCRHALQRPPPSNFQELLLSGRIELQNCIPKLKPLSPLCPPPRCVLSFHREHGRSTRRIPHVFNRNYFLPRQFKKPIQLLF